MPKFASKLTAEEIDTLVQQIRAAEQEIDEWLMRRLRCDTDS